MTSPIPPSQSRAAHLDPKNVYPAQFRQATELLGRILGESLPADRQIDQYFRANRQMGGRDRRFVAEVIYAILRERRYLTHSIAGDSAPMMLVAAYLRCCAGWTVDDLKAKGLPSSFDCHNRADLPFAVRVNLPDWLAERWLAQYGKVEAEALALALNQSAPLDIRCNTLKTNRDILQAELTRQGYPCEIMPWSPQGLRRRERQPLFSLANFQQGEFEVQDEGSQLVSMLVGARPGMKVADLCAGAGGKTLALAAEMRNRGEILATDIIPRRLEELRRRIRRAGVNNVRVAMADDHSILPWKNSCQRVLVDAPCSGTGTLRRNPDLKWKPVDLTGLPATQGQLMNWAADYVKPGGRLIYVTCSLLKEENQDVVDGFLSRNPQFQRLQAMAILNEQGVALDNATTEAGDLQLLPHRHGTDGFFAAVLERPSH